MIELKLTLNEFNMDVGVEFEEATETEQLIIGVAEYAINKLAQDQEFFESLLNEINAQYAEAVH